MNVRLRSIVLLVAIAVALVGCQRGPRFYQVTGTVSYQGKPVSEGQIIFTPSDGDGPAATASIQSGAYEISTIAGEKIVRITASEATGRILDGAMGAKIPEMRDLIPPKYNSESTLTRTVDPAQSLTIDFALE